LKGLLGALLLFGPGYVVTAGYYWRAFGNPSPGFARGIWGLSLLVQGAWLSLVHWYAQPNSFDVDWVFGLVVGLVYLWWLGSAAVSLIALVAEPGYTTAVLPADAVDRGAR
jgi:hypothetical protein